MITFTYQIHARMGLHARPASDLSTIARNYHSLIMIHSKKRSANARRIVDLMEMNAGKDEILVFVIEGDDEELAAEAIRTYCESKL